jgi:tellurite resistance protein TehA-like permease
MQPLVPAEHPLHHHHRGRIMAIARPVVMLRAAVRDLPPASFAMVMATGIVALALHALGMPGAATGFFIVGAVMYGVLWIMSLLRVARFWPQVSHDLLDHRHAPGFFTLVAASCILGVQCLLQFRDPQAATAFWGLGVVLWVSLTYTIFTALTIKHHKPSLAAGITGGWSLAIVGAQSIAVLSTHLAEVWQPAYRLDLNFFALALWLWGGMFYIWTMSLIFYRYTFFALTPRDLSPPYWINMGAMAISVLAGTRLVDNSANAPFLLELVPFLKGFTIFYWATGTWWIPMLVALELWRYVFRHSPLRYAPANWSAVFPLGMYTVCTLNLARAFGLPFLDPVPRFFLIIALAAWVLTFGGLLHHLGSWTTRLARAARRRRLAG